MDLAFLLDDRGLVVAHHAVHLYLVVPAESESLYTQVCRAICKVKGSRFTQNISPRLGVEGLGCVRARREKEHS